MKLKKKLTAALLSAALAAGVCPLVIPVFASEGSWNQTDGSYWYQYEDGSNPAGKWAKINGTWYLFDEEGWMKSGWNQWEGDWYFLGGPEDGSLKRGWIKDGTDWYYADSAGKMLKGWLPFEGKYYYLDSSGQMARGWKTIEGNAYYFSSDGHMAADTVVDGYRIGPDGIWIRGPHYGEPLSGKVVYLTFDDGPSQNTEKILDILKQYGIQATFFVTGCNPSWNHMIQRADREGHTIALHTYTHDYAKCYASEAAYFNDLNQVSDMVEGLVGYRPDLIRFPGGSSNTVSRNYCSGIMSRLVHAVEERGYTYFDWNVTSMDAEAVSVSTQRILQCSLHHQMEKIVFLFHDSAPKTTTPEALPTIIEHYLSRGYQFTGLRPDAYSAHHHPQN